MKSLTHLHAAVVDQHLVNRLCPVSKKWEKDDLTPPQCRYAGGRRALSETAEGSTIPLTSRHLPSGTKTSVFVNAQKLHTASMVSRLKVVSEVSNNVLMRAVYTDGQAMHAPQIITFCVIQPAIDKVRVLEFCNKNISDMYICRFLQCHRWYRQPNDDHSQILPRDPLRSVRPRFPYCSPLLCGIN